MIRKVFGTGGIGTGLLFELSANQPLSRNESRLGFLTDYKDYCKCHIILHYISALTKGINVYAIGVVGRDTQGEELLSEMESAGISTRFVEMTEKARTLFSVCFQYPDGTGGNITSSNSACSLVTPEWIDQCAMDIDENSLVLAVPEVPVNSRIRLLEIGKERNAFTVSSFLGGEATAFEKAGGFQLSDLLSINIDEAKAVSDNLETAMNKIADLNHEIKLIVTAGENGSYVFENRALTHIPCIREKIVSSAGAGDALLGGAIAGLASGKSFIEAVEYGVVIARFAVLSKNTIANEVTVESVNQYIGNNSCPIAGSYIRG